MIALLEISEAIEAENNKLASGGISEPHLYSEHGRIGKPGSEYANVRREYDRRQYLYENPSRLIENKDKIGDHPDNDEFLLGARWLLQYPLAAVNSFE